MSSAARRIVALAAVLVLGVASRRIRTGLWLWDKSLGDALYAAAVYLVLGLLFRSLRPSALALAAAGFCLGIELFQLTGLPARLSSVPLVRWLLGTTFSPHDFLCYAVGVAAVAWLDQVWMSRSPQIHSADE